MENAIVYNTNGEKVSEIKLCELFSMELRPDMVDVAQSRVNQNHRQPYAVSKYAGMKHSAKSWGTGRAIARVPRVRGGGTRRSGQGAFAPFTRGGRNAFPTTTLKRLGRKTPRKMRQIVTAMGIAATANASIVEGRGHVVDKVKSFPVVITDDVAEIKKTATAAEVLKNMGLYDDCMKVKESKGIRAGKGKWRNRRYTQKKGLLIIHDDSSFSPAFNSIPGVELLNVNKLNLLKLCSGGKLGRLTMFTQSAFEKIEFIFSSECKTGFSLPNKMIGNSNLDEYFYSDDVQNLITLPSLLPKGNTKKSEEDIKRAQELVEMYQ